MLAEVAGVDVLAAAGLLAAAAGAVHDPAEEEADDPVVAVGILAEAEAVRDPAEEAANPVVRSVAPAAVLPARVPMADIPVEAFARRDRKSAAADVRRRSIGVPRSAIPIPADLNEADTIRQSRLPVRYAGRKGQAKSAAFGREDPSGRMESRVLADNLDPTLFTVTTETSRVEMEPGHS